MKAHKRGFSLLELMVSIAIAGIVITMGITGLGKARTQGSSKGLAAAVSSEFKYARETAIASGGPVAVVVPRGAGRSLFWLQGTTMPVVSRSVNYEGDYPNGAITVASYPGPTYVKNATMPGFKAEAWVDRLESWIPNQYKDDFVFVFTPNGSVLTNDLPSADGSYRVIVSMGAQISNGSAPSGSLDYVSGNDNVYFRLDAAGEPNTIAISMGGAVESDQGLLGWDGTGVSTAGAPQGNAPNPPSPEFDYTAVIPTILKSEITPPAEEIDGEMVHVLDKGEYLTLEIFATSGDGRPIYANWKDTPVTQPGDDFRGRFSVPNGDPERMEFYPEYPDIDGDGNPETNIWRSVWTWTPPGTANPGDRYILGVDVKDAKAEFEAVLPDPIPPVTVAPPGEIVFEREYGGRTHLWTMWTDGSRQRRLTKGEHDYKFASATGDGKVIAFQRDAYEVWIMNSDGTGQVRVADQGKMPTISPTGSAIAYMKNDGNVYVKRIDRPGNSEKQIPSRETQVTNAPQGNRVAFSPDGKNLYVTDAGGDKVSRVALSYSGDEIYTSAPQGGDVVPNIANTPQVGGLATDRKGEFLYYHADSTDPYLGRYPLTNGNLGTIGPITGNNVRKSVGQLETFPTPSPDGNLVLFCQPNGSGVLTIYKCPKTSFGSAGAEVALAAGNRPAWIMQRGSL